jgi:hypothetical protein
MLWRSVMVAALAALAAVAWTDSAKAGGDTMRLGGVDAPTMTLGGNADADTVAVWRRWGGYGGYYRPSYYYGGYGGYGGYGYNYYRPYSYSYGYSYYRPYSYGYGYSYYPRYSYGYSYYPRYYGYGSYYPRYSYGYSYYYPIGSGDACGPQVVRVPGNPGTTLTPQEGAPAAPPAVKDGTFPYDGGPDRPVPMPKVEDETEGTRIPPKTTPRVEGIPVSIPAKAKYVYPAYGENLRR